MGDPAPSPQGKGPTRCFQEKPLNPWDKRISFRRQPGIPQAMQRSELRTRMIKLSAASTRSHASIVRKLTTRTLLYRQRRVKAMQNFDHRNVTGCHYSDNSSTRASTKARISVPYQTSPTEDTSAVERPLRQDSASYSMRDALNAGFEEGDDFQVQQVRARTRVAIRREQVLRIRRAKRDRRQQLHQLRAAFRETITIVTKKIREFIAQGIEPEEVELYFDQLQRAQDELGPIEDEYDSFEILLEEEEEKLELEEGHFYRYYAVRDVKISQSAIDEQLSPLVKPYESSEPDSYDLASDSLVQQYLSKTSRAERLKKELDNLEDDYFKLTEDSNFRKDHGFPVSKSAAAFLDDYSTLRRATLDELHNVEDALFHLRDECLEQNLFSESDHPYKLRDALYEDIFDLIEETEERLSLRVAAYMLDYFKELPDGVTQTRQEYVNEWLLKWLQDSTIGEIMLKAHISFECENLGTADEMLQNGSWSRLALDHWDTDDAGANTDFYFYQSKFDAIAGGTGNPEGSGTLSDGLGHDEYNSLGADLDKLELNLSRAQAKSTNASRINSFEKDQSSSKPLLKHARPSIPAIRTSENPSNKLSAVALPPTSLEAILLPLQPSDIPHGTMKRRSIELGNLSICFSENRPSQTLKRSISLRAN